MLFTSCDNRPRADDPQMSVRHNPFYDQIRQRLGELGNTALVPWQGYVWRFNSIEYPKPADILSGLGAYTMGSRWNARGEFRVVYGSTQEDVAIKETKVSEAYYGLTVRKPRLFVCIQLNVSCMLDLSSSTMLHRLGLRLKDVQAEDWRKLHDAGHESLTQCIGRAAFDFGAEGLLCRSARVKRGLNFAWFPQNNQHGSVAMVCHEDLLSHVGNVQPQE